MTELNQKEKILRERAIQLRKPKNDHVIIEDFLDGLTFCLAEEEYFVNSSYISEVIGIQKITPLPCSPDFIIGIINIRGRIVSVIELKSILGLPKTEISQQKKVVVFQNNDIEFGVLVDSVIGNSKMNMLQLQNAMPFEDPQNKGFIKGITNEKVIILDIEKIINSENIIVNEQV